MYNDRGVSNLNRNIHNNANDSDKSEIICTIPNSHVLVYKSQVTKLKEKVRKFDTIMKNIEADKYKWSEVGNNMIGFAASCIPNAGYSGVYMTLPFLLVHFWRIVVYHTKEISS